MHRMAVVMSRRAAILFFKPVLRAVAAVVAIIHLIFHPTGLATGRAKEVRL